MLNNKTSLTLLLLLNLAVVLVSLGSGPAPAWGLVPRQNLTTTTRGNLTSADIEVVLATHNCYRAYALHSSAEIPFDELLT